MTSKQMPITNANCFASLLKSLNGIVGIETICQGIVNAYTEPHRFYHNLQHINECLQLFERYRHLADNALEVKLALWFHDAVYDTKAADNEEKSAVLAKTLLFKSGIADEVVVNVSNLILATKHQQLAQTNDEKLIQDIDLAILAASPVRFAEYQWQIRQEYAWVPEIIYRQKRTEVLNSFYNRAQIYSSAEIYKELELQARWNLQRALSALQI